MTPSSRKMPTIKGESAFLCGVDVSDEVGANRISLTGAELGFRWTLEITTAVAISRKPTQKKWVYLDVTSRKSREG